MIIDTGEAECLTVNMGKSKGTSLTEPHYSVYMCTLRCPANNLNYLYTMHTPSHCRRKKYFIFPKAKHRIVKSDIVFFFAGTN